MAITGASSNGPQKKVWHESDFDPTKLAGRGGGLAAFSAGADGIGLDRYSANGSATGRATGIYAGRGATGFLFAKGSSRLHDTDAISAHASAALARRNELQEEQQQQLAQRQGNGINLFGLG